MRAVEDLPVAGVMSQKANLCERERQECRVEQLQPETVDDEQERDARAKECQADERVEDEVAWLLLEQSRGDNAPL